MFIKFKGADGSMVLVNTDHVTHIGAAADSASKRPILGQAAIMFLNGQGVAVIGSVDSISELLIPGASLSRV